MTDEELEKDLEELVKVERDTTTAILYHIIEAEKRRIPQLRGYSSAQDWLTGVYKYSEPAANRRIQAARLLKAVPEVAEKLEEGKVNLTTLSQAQSAIQREERRSGKKVDRRQVVEKIQCQSSRATEKTLTQEFPELSFQKDSLRAINETESRLNIIIDEETRGLLELARSQLSHAVPDGSANEILKRALRELVKQGDTGTKRNRVLKRAGHKCEWVDPVTGRRCNSTYQLEVDHIRPKALGGTDEIENLRCLCKQHNLLAAERAFGRDRMDRFRAHV